jgi:hypothetical protein
MDGIEKFYFPLKKKVTKMVINRKIESIPLIFMSGDLWLKKKVDVTRATLDHFKKEEVFANNSV